MRLDRRGTWTETARELRQIAWAVLLIDLIAIGVGALASRSMGESAFLIGIGLALFVTLCFGLIVAGNLAAESLANWWLGRRKP
jgi:hypothetical protein